MGFAEGFDVGFRATSSLMEATFSAMRKRRETDEANKAMAEAEAQQQEIDAKYMQLRQDKQAEIEEGLKTGELSDMDALRQSIQIGADLDTQRDLETGNLWGGVLSRNADNAFLVKSAGARWGTDMERAKQRDARKQDALMRQAQILEREASEAGATSRALAAQGVNPFEEGTEYHARFVENEEYRDDAKAMDLALKFHGGKSSDLSNIMAALNPEAAGEQIGAATGGAASLEQFMDTAAVMRDMIRLGPDGYEKARSLAQKEAAKRKKAQEKVEAEEAPAAPTARQRGATARKAMAAGGGPSTKAQPSKEVLEHMGDWWSGYFSGEAQAQDGG